MTRASQGNILAAARATSLLIEIARVRRPLTLPRWHQVAIRAEIIILLADRDMIVVLVAIIFSPDRVSVALVALNHGPRTGQRVIDGGDLVIKDIGIGLVEKNPFLDNRLVVRMEGKTIDVEITRTLHVARLDLKYVVSAIPVLVDPSADGISGEGGLDRFGPRATVGVDPARHDIFGQDVGGLRRNDDFERINGGHDP